MKEFRFAIMGAGNIANRFAHAIGQVEGAKVCAIASQSMEKARSFAEKWQIPACYDSYEQMLIKEKPDCVYIATIPSMHFKQAVLCAEYGVPVLCEKSMFMDYEEAKAFDEIAKEKGIFWMEAMWSRFLPTNVEVKRLIESGAIGKVVYADCEIGFKADLNPEMRYMSAALGGGAARDVTCYAYMVTEWILGSTEESCEVTASFSDTGVDVVDAALLKLKNGVPVVIKCSFLNKMFENLTIQGTDGMIVIPQPHMARGFEVYDSRRGELLSTWKDETGRNGFTYEIEETMRCIREGLKESPMVPHEDTLAFAAFTSKIYALKK